jgi:hypothetical protein
MEKITTDQRAIRHPGRLQSECPADIIGIRIEKLTGDLQQKNEAAETGKRLGDSLDGVCRTGNRLRTDTVTGSHRQKTSMISTTKLSINGELLMIAPVRGSRSGAEAGTVTPR